MENYIKHLEELSLRLEKDILELKEITTPAYMASQMFGDTISVSKNRSCSTQTSKDLIEEDINK
ncbi:MAG TPA: hypothetical protein DCZ03_15140 [Gammaproteobacteria bacterium]|nr:hypothetical protein [Gammaproteobacteria bacterium]